MSTIDLSKNQLIDSMESCPTFYNIAYIIIQLCENIDQTYNKSINVISEWRKLMPIEEAKLL